MSNISVKPSSLSSFEHVAVALGRPLKRAVDKKVFFNSPARIISTTSGAVGLLKLLHNGYKRFIRSDFPTGVERFFDWVIPSVSALVSLGSELLGAKGIDSLKALEEKASNESIPKSDYINWLMPKVLEKFEKEMRPHFFAITTNESYFRNYYAKEGNFINSELDAYELIFNELIKQNNVFHSIYGLKINRLSGSDEIYIETNGPLNYVDKDTNTMYKVVVKLYPNEKFKDFIFNKRPIHIYSTQNKDNPSFIPVEISSNTTQPQISFSEFLSKEFITKLEKFECKDSIDRNQSIDIISFNSESA